MNCQDCVTIFNSYPILLSALSKIVPLFLLIVARFFTNQINISKPKSRNLVADALARHGQGLSLFSSQWWPAPPTFIQSFLAKDRYGMPSSRLNIR
ncbi:transmembrane protein, putative [Medicago truncatula]|uniref:Transmembrane protein, putative n=1 Tax=Medicago truncatula TaxID=3880 RepID=G7L9J7_MEDTR|nr:transmembrane protein, putative [Medicago truncatula]